VLPRGARRSLGYSLALAFTLGLTLATAPGASAADGAVTVRDNAFQPSAVTIGVNETVTWSNLGQKTHTVTADDGSFNSGPLAPGDAYATVFPKAGTFTYHCTIHPNVMKGTVTVGAAVPPPSTAPEPTPPAGTVPPSFPPLPTQVAAPSVGSPAATASGATGAGSGNGTGTGSGTASDNPLTAVAKALPSAPVLAIVAAIVVLIGLSFFVPRRRRR
jgi:plastocyanin